MLHNNLLESQPDQTSVEQVLSTTLQGIELSTAAMNFVMQTPPRVKPSSSVLPPQMTLSRQITDAEFAGDSEQGYKNFLNFLISGHSKTYNDIVRSWSGKSTEKDKEDINPFKHNLNLDKDYPFYSGNWEGTNLANECATAFLNFFWDRADNLNLNRQIHAVTKKNHIDGLGKIRARLHHLFEIFNKKKPFKTNLSEFHYLVKTNDSKWRENLEVYRDTNETALLAIEEIAASIPEEFHDYNELFKQLTLLLARSRDVFDSDSLVDTAPLLPLENLHILIRNFIEYLRTKFQRLDKVIKEVQENLSASCLSFVTAKNNEGKNLCYLSISSPQHNSSLLTALTECIDAYNASAQASLKSKYKFYVITEPASHNSQLLIQKIIGFTASPHPADPFKHCSEKSYITMLAKLCYEKDITITGIANVNLLPLNNIETQRMNKKFPDNQLVSISIKQQEINFCIIPACKHCQVNKIGAVIFMGAASEYREYVIQQLRQEHALRSVSQSFFNTPFNTPERKEDAKSLFLSPQKGLHPLTPERVQTNRPKLTDPITERLSFPTLTRLGSPKRS